MATRLLTSTVRIALSLIKKLQRFFSNADANNIYGTRVSGDAGF
jgi:hypothetical protein